MVFCKFGSNLFKGFVFVKVKSSYEVFVDLPLLLGELLTFTSCRYRWDNSDIIRTRGEPDNQFRARCLTEVHFGLVGKAVAVRVIEETNKRVEMT